MVVQKGSYSLGIMYTVQITNRHVDSLETYSNLSVLKVTMKLGMILVRFSIIQLVDSVSL